MVYSISLDLLLVGFFDIWDLIPYLKRVFEGMISTS